MNSRFRRFAILVLLLLPFAAAARVDPAALPREGRAIEVIDGDTLRLDSGREVRLVGIQAPKLPLGRPNFPHWPLAPESKAGLETLALGKRLALSYGGTPVDRYGRLLAELTDETGRWIQGELLAQGLARAYTFPDNRARAADLHKREAEARAARRGIWASPHYRVQQAASEVRALSGFELVEGRVLAVAQNRGRTYLNFGADWRSDFTVAVSDGGRRMFREAGIELGQLEGKQIRVRGWLKFENGPMIEANHPEQIEILAQ
jgi:micrococcal nuclease